PTAAHRTARPAVTSPSLPPPNAPSPDAPTARGPPPDSAGSRGLGSWRPPFPPPRDRSPRAAAPPLRRRAIPPHSPHAPSLSALRGPHRFLTTQSRVPYLPRADSHTWPVSPHACNRPASFLASIAATCVSRVDTSSE